MQRKVLPIVVDRGALEAIRLGGCQPQLSRFPHRDAPAPGRVDAAAERDLDLSLPGICVPLLSERLLHAIALGIRVGDDPCFFGLGARNPRPFSNAHLISPCYLLGSPPDRPPMHPYAPLFARSKASGCVGGIGVRPESAEGVSLISAPDICCRSTCRPDQTSPARGRQLGFRSSSGLT